uniref:Nuclear pore complex protein Nup88 n=1 Tax=Timema monikensis TaxID=170555 RepID=A0A7R9HI95_9NEOP|nr:unnamed protein product [Timema monikensis]
MEISTDHLGLSEHNLFHNLSKQVSQLSPKTRNVLECKADVLFVWSFEESCLLTLNIKTSSINQTDVKYQTLVPTDPPSFDIERLTVNETCTQVAVFGPHGICVLDIPQRWGKLGMFQGGNAAVTCKSRSLDERHFTCHPHIVIKQVRWHPGSATDSHLLVLSSENTFHLYQTAGDRPILLNTWTVGRRPSSARVHILIGLGDTSVDFDFAPPVTGNSLTLYTSKQSSLTDSVMWPILVLHGNGNIYSVLISLSDKASRPIIHGPLRMHPPAEDNYGVDACSILCLQSVPPTVVVATCSGTLYHCLLLNTPEEETEEETNRNDSWNSLNSVYILRVSRVTLFVFECVELELGLGLKDEDLYTCPILLHRDCTTVSRYFCTHDTGVHAMSLAVVGELERFAESKDEDMDLSVPALEEHSTCQYLVCTRTSSSSPLAPVQGLTVATSPPVLVCLLCTGEVVSLSLTSVTLFPHALPIFEENRQEEAGVTLKKEAFDEHVLRLLQHETLQPILKLAPSADPPAQECLELVSRATTVLREEYIQRHVRVRDEIEGKVRTLRRLKTHQLQEVRSLEEEQHHLKLAAEDLAEKYEDIKDKQEELTRRVELVLRAVCMRQPGASAAEKKFGSHLQTVNSKLCEYRSSLEQIRTKQSYQHAEMEKWLEQQKKQHIHLTNSQQNIIKDNLVHMSRSIRKITSCVEGALKVIQADKNSFSSVATLGR